MSRPIFHVTCYLLLALFYVAGNINTPLANAMPQGNPSSPLTDTAAVVSPAPQSSVDAGASSLQQPLQPPVQPPVQPSSDAAAPPVQQPLQQPVQQPSYNAAAVPPSALTSPQRVYNPPEDANYPTYKLRQWTQNAKDKAWCMSASDPLNSGDNQLGLREEECNITAARQNLQFWQLVDRSEYYKFRFRDSSKCLSVISSTPTMPATSNVAVAGQRLQRRNVIVSDILDAIGVSKGPAAGGPNTSVKIEGVATGAPSIIPPRPTPTDAVANEPVAEPTTAPSPPTTYAGPVAASSANLVLSDCIDNNAQVFRARLVEKPGLKNKYYQIMSHTARMCITGRGVKDAAISLMPCRDNDDSQLWLLEDIQLNIKDADTTHSIMEYAATFQVADFEQRLGLKRGSSFRGLTPEEIEDLDTSMPGSSAVIGMAFDLAEQIRTYVEDTAQYQRSGAPLVPELVSIFLTPDDYPNAWDKVWGITSTVLSFIPIPGVMEIFKMGAVSLIGQITADVNEHRKAKPATPTELSAWLRFALEQCDYTADSLYKSFLEVFRQARIGQLRTLLEEFRAGKYYISGEDFYRRYRVSFLKQLVSTKGNGGFWVSVCVANDASRCQGSSWNIEKLKNHSSMQNTYYASNLPEDAVRQLIQIGEKDNFYNGKDGWPTERFYYTCKDSRCEAKLRMAPGTNKLERI